MNLQSIYNLVETRKNTPKTNSYVSGLFSQGQDRIIQKVGEEAVEVVIAAKNTSPQGTIEELVSESSDLLFHLMVLLVEKGVTLQDIEAELEQRHLCK